MNRVVHDVALYDTNSQKAMVRHGAFKTKAILVDDLRIPIHFCLGRFEAATDEELHELIADLTHERERRVS